MDAIQYCGRYEYRDAAGLELALAQARETLDDDEVGEVFGWLRFFVCRGTQLTVNVSAPATAEHRFAAANLFLVLAQGAVDGSVEATHNHRAIDRYVASLGLEDC